MRLARTSSKNDFATRAEKFVKGTVSEESWKIDRVVWISTRLRGKPASTLGALHIGAQTYYTFTSHAAGVDSHLEIKVIN